MSSPVRVPRPNQTLVSTNTEHYEGKTKWPGGIKGCFFSFFFVRTADLNSHQTAVLMPTPFMPSNKKQELTHMSQFTNETAAF